MNKKVIFILSASLLLLTACSSQLNKEARLVKAKEYFDEGLIQLNKKDLKKAIDNLRMSIELDPNNYESHYWLAVSYAYRKVPASYVLREFKTAIKLNPYFPKPYRDLGIIYAMQGNMTEGKEYLEKAIKLDNKDPLSLVNLGYIYFTEKKYDKTEDLYEKAKNINPEGTLLWNNYGMLKYETGELEKAEECFNNSLNINKEQPDPYKYLALIEEKRGNQEKAAYYKELANKYKR